MKLWEQMHLGYFRSVLTHWGKVKMADILQMRVPIGITLISVPKGPINNKPALYRIIA